MTQSVPSISNAIELTTSEVPQPFVCRAEGCDRRFPTRGMLVYHKRTVHQNEVSVQYPGEGLFVNAVNHKFILTRSI